MLSPSAILDRLRLSLWFIPSLFALGAAVAAFGLIRVDRALDPDTAQFFQFGGTADGARSVLEAVAQSMLTFTGLVFTITMLVLQLASSQLSPRVMRTFLRDRQNQVVLGLFVATFLYTLLVLREVRSGEVTFVPGVSIWVAFALLVTSVGAFVYYIDHMAHAIRASTVIANIAGETREAIDRHYPLEPPGETLDELAPDALDRLRRPDPQVIASTKVGTVTNLGEGLLMRATKDLDAVVEFVPIVGDFVPEGTPLFLVHWRNGGELRERMGSRGKDGKDGRPRQGGDATDKDDGPSADSLRDAVAFGEERTLQQDVTFGFRQLVDVATRALSPGTNDPTTAVQAIDHLHDLLRRMAVRPFPSPILVDDDGTPRAIIHRPEWADYVRLCFDELRLYGEGHIAITRRLRQALEDIESVCGDARRGPIRDQLMRLERSVKRAFDDPRDEEAARTTRAGAGGSSEAREEEAP